MSGLPGKKGKQGDTGDILDAPPGRPGRPGTNFFKKFLCFFLFKEIYLSIFFYFWRITRIYGRQRS